MLYPVFALIIISINAILGIVAVAANSRRLQNRLFALLMLSFVVWVSGSLMLASVPDPDRAFFWGRFSWLGISFIAPLYLHFVLSFENRLVPLHIYIPAFVFAYLSAFSDILVSGLHVSAGNFMYCAGCFDDVAYGAAFLPFSVYFLFSIFYGLYRSIRLLRYLNGLELVRMRLMVIGTAIPILTGSVTDVVFPLFGVYGYGIAEYLTVVMAVFFFYAFFEARPTE